MATKNSFASHYAEQLTKRLPVLTKPLTQDDPASLLMEQQKKTLDEIRPACVKLSDAVKDYVMAKDEVEKKRERKKINDDLPALTVDGSVTTATETADSIWSGDDVERGVELGELPDVADVVEVVGSFEGDAGERGIESAEETTGQTRVEEVEDESDEPDLEEPSVAVIVPAIADVYADLQRIAADKAFIIDSNLGDYIFFPIDFLLSRRPVLPNKALELIANVALTLLKTAWKLAIDGPMGLRLLGRLSALVDERKMATDYAVPGSELVAEEIHLPVMQGMEKIFTGFKALRPDDKFDMFHRENLPIMAEAVYVTLAEIEPPGKKDAGGAPAAAAGSLPVQMAALETLTAFCRIARRGELMAKHFLPGIVSTMTKMLSVRSAGRRHYTMLEKGLNILSDLFVYLMDDGSSANFWKPEEEREKEVAVSFVWLEPSLPHIKNSLKAISALKDHDRAEIRLGLGRLCVRLLENCRVVLKETVPLLIETFISAVSESPPTDQTSDLEVVEPMRQLLAVDGPLQDQLKTVLYEWVKEIPMVIRHPDERVRSRAFSHLRFGLELVEGAFCDMSAVGTALRDGLVDGLEEELVRSKKRRGPPVTAYPSEMELAERAGSDTQQFKPLVLREASQHTDVLVQMSAFLKSQAVSKVLLDRTGPLLNSVMAGPVDAQTSALYVLLNTVRPTFEESQQFGEFAFLADLSGPLALLDDLYYFSTTALATQVEDPVAKSAWRLHALALEVVALQARQYGEEFRTELMDVLYPVLSCVGSQEEPLREHALVCLDQLAAACQYSDVQDMLVSNADYLVNAVGLKLGIFEPDTQAPRVMMVLVKLCGPAIVPFIGDLVDSLFAVLEANREVHGTVEKMFAVLEVVAQEAARAPGLDISENVYGKMLPAIRSMTWEEVREAVARAEKGALPSEDDLDLSNLQPGAVEAELASREKAEEEVTPFETAEKAAVTSVFSRKRPYGTLLRIANLTQHYLSSPAPSFRRSLLELLARVFPTAALHDDSFLPLIHTLWPVVLARLRIDRDEFVRAAAVDVLTAACVGSGTFVRSRIEEAWPLIWRLASQVGPTSVAAGVVVGAADKEEDVLGKLCTGRSRSGQRDNGVKLVSAGPGADAPYVPMTRRVQQESMTRLLLAVVSFVGVDTNRMLEIVQWFGPVLETDELVRRILERRGADEVWWVRFQRGAVEIEPMEEMEGRVFAKW